MEAVSRGREGTNTPQGPSAAVWWSWKLRNHYPRSKFLGGKSFWDAHIFWVVQSFLRDITYPKITTSRTQKKRELPAKVQDQGWKRHKLDKKLPHWYDFPQHSISRYRYIFLRSPLATRRVLVDSWSQLCSSFLIAEQDGWMLKAPDTITIDTILAWRQVQFIISTDKAPGTKVSMLAWRQVQFIISTDKAPGTIVSMLARFNANVTGKKPGMTKMCNWLNARCYIGRFTEFKQVPLNLVLNGQKQWTMFNPIREFKGKYDAKRYWDSWTMNNVQGAC